MRRQSAITRNAIALKPALAAAHANIVNAYLDCCEWDEIDRWDREFLEYRRGRDGVQELGGYDWSPIAPLTLFPGALHKEIAVVSGSAGRGDP
jgi:hypothetical protein